MLVRHGRPAASSGADVIRASHAELRVTDLDAAHAFYVDLLGFVLTARTSNALYLRGLEERDHHSLVLRLAESAGVGHLGYRVRHADDLERLEHALRAAGCLTRWVDDGEELGQGRALRANDPFGLPVEFVHDVERVERMLQRFDHYRGAHVMRFDHFNCQVPDVGAAYNWYADVLGFGASEYTVSGDGNAIWAIWTQRKGNVHDLALMTGIGPRLHHVGFWAADPSAILRACDVLAAAGLTHSIERGPGRHGISNAFFLYLRDPDGNRIELYSNDYLVVDPDWEPIRWELNDPRRQTFWGHAAPASWFDEASLCEDVLSGEFKHTETPLLEGRPQHVT